MRKSVIELTIRTERSSVSYITAGVINLLRPEATFTLSSRHTDSGIINIYAPLTNYLLHLARKPPNKEQLEDQPAIITE